MEESEGNDKRAQKFKGLFYIIAGMIFGLVFGVSIFLPLDKTRGWNPFGFWFLATFIATIVGGIFGLLFYGAKLKKEL